MTLKTTSPDDRKTGLFRRLNALMRDRRGAGAVEFALLAPLLLVLYLGAFELTLGLSVSKRATKASGTVADLVTQQTSVNKAYLATMVDVAKAIFLPYDTAKTDDMTTLSMKITGIAIDSTGSPKVLWSWDQSNGRPYAVGNVVSVPTDMKKANTFVVHTELSIPHQMLMFLANLSSSQTTLTISRDFFFRQRVGDSVTCSDC